MAARRPHAPRRPSRSWRGYALLLDQDTLHQPQATSPATVQASRYGVQDTRSQRNATATPATPDCAQVTSDKTVWRGVWNSFQHRRRIQSEDIFGPAGGAPRRLRARHTDRRHRIVIRHRRRRSSPSLRELIRDIYLTTELYILTLRKYPDLLVHQRQIISISAVVNKYDQERRKPYPRSEVFPNQSYSHLLASAIICSLAGCSMTALSVIYSTSVPF